MTRARLTAALIVFKSISLPGPHPAGRNHLPMMPFLKHTLTAQQRCSWFPVATIMTAQHNLSLPKSAYGSVESAGMVTADMTMPDVLAYTIYT